jgi:Asp-tRNA(Asn)/Glu-tRNA(Gln) amidotransferase B subunit
VLPTDTPQPPEPPEPTVVVSELERLVDEVIANNPQAVADYFDGRRQALIILLNDLRERAKDRIKFNINEAREVLVRKLEELRP